MAKLFGISLFIVLLGLAILKTSASGGQQKKIRQKREWIVPPRKLRENVNYQHLEYVAKIRSDEETRTSIQYFLTGPGADQPPIKLFTVDRDKGLVKIHGVLDREKTPLYHRTSSSSLDPLVPLVSSCSSALPPLLTACGPLDSPRTSRPPARHEDEDSLVSPQASRPMVSPPMTPGPSPAPLPPPKPPPSLHSWMFS